MTEITVNDLKALLKARYDVPEILVTGMPGKEQSLYLKLEANA
jgi:hypothetical protein